MLEKMDAFFEARLAGYEEHMLNNIESAVEFYPFTADCLPDIPEAKILDLGCGTGLELNWYYHRKIGIDIPLFWKTIAKMSPVMFICGSAAWFVLNKTGIRNWGEFFLYAVIYTAVFLVLAYLFMMNEYERDLICIPIRKVLRKFRKEN